MNHSPRGRRWLTTVCLATIVWSATSHAAPPARRQDGHIPGSLVDLLDADDFSSVPINNDDEPGPAPQNAPRPGVLPMPPAGNPNAGIDLQNLIATRHELVDDCKFFELLKKTLEAEQAFAAANQAIQAANAAANAAAQAVNMAAAQKNGGLVAQAERQLRDARQAAGKAAQRFGEAKRKVEGLYGQFFPNVEKLLATYHEMRKFVGQDRADPNMPAVRAVLNQAVNQRRDFYEGRILASICELCCGEADAARRHLAAAQFFAAPVFFAWPFANDMCLAYLLLGEPDQIDAWTKWVSDVDEKRKTATRCWLVALHAAIQCEDNKAKTWFTRCERKLMLAANKAKVPLAVPPQVAGDWAVFLLTCPNENIRNAGLEKAKALVAAVDGPGASDWRVLRARGAFAAAEGRWAAASQAIEECLEHAPGRLRTELERQLAAYRNQEPWIRPRQGQG